MEASEFGRMVRRRREATAPADVGLPVGSRRRAPGLRREELAGLAGISPDYLTRLEQGRATSPSAQVVEALARALRLSDSDRDLLYRLAGHAAPGLDLMPTRIPASISRMLDRFATTPVGVFDATNTLLVANRPYDALMGDTTAWKGLERTSLWRHLVGPGSRVVHTPAEFDELIRLQVADLRLTAARYPRDASLASLVARLTDASPLFASLWRTGSTELPRELGRRKVVDHPAVGRIELDCDTLIVAQDDLRILIYTAEPGTEDAARLDLAIVVGTQALVD
ncbi:helix-turn-helix transcriptional regulator [Frondihabitans australicus]|uniref:Helix-turn-helix protein n=1 Tax=Frondihabitans australicus TaxID=386892 RepID=A0A495IEE3_9MICO|nr:helix-turn-helix transcriptional regulator [Frondihabitans australicus]RKR73386.1 helix-turn-helix protein [Frondihabitans australicus]